MEVELPSFKDEVLKRLDFLEQFKIKGPALYAIANDLYHLHLIRKSTQDKPSSKEIAKDLKARTEFQQTMKDLKKHCHDIIIAFENAEDSAGKFSSLTKATAQIKSLLDESAFTFDPINQSLISITSRDSGYSGVNPSPLLKHRSDCDIEEADLLHESQLRFNPINRSLLSIKSASSGDSGVSGMSVDYNPSPLPKCKKALVHFDTTPHDEKINFVGLPGKIQENSVAIVNVDITVPYDSCQYGVESLDHQSNKDIFASSYQCDRDIHQNTDLTEIQQFNDDKSSTGYTTAFQCTDCDHTILKLSDFQAAVQHKVSISWMDVQTAEKIHHYSDQAPNYLVIPTFHRVSIPVPPRNVPQKCESQCKEIAVQVDHSSAPQSSGILHAV